MVEATRIRSEKRREQQYREGYPKSLEGKGDDNVEHMWEQVKRAMVESSRELCGSVRIGGKCGSSEF